MIASLRGKLIYTDNTVAVVECAGVGFKCFVTKNTLYNLPQKNEEVFLHTYMVVREDAMDLYGFESIEELDAFKLITSVNGVGAKIGLALLSEFTASRLIMHIASNDPKPLTAAAGVGIKLAQRIVLELKDKFSAPASVDNDTAPDIAEYSADNGSQAVGALVNLGYSQSEAQSAVAKTDTSQSVEDIIKNALKYLF